MFDSLSYRDDIDISSDDPLILEVSKEKGENSNLKPNQRKKNKKKSNTTVKGLEARRSKIDQQTKVKPQTSTP